MLTFLIHKKIKITVNIVFDDANLLLFLDDNWIHGLGMDSETFGVQRKEVNACKLWSFNFPNIFTKGGATKCLLF